MLCLPAPCHLHIRVGLMLIVTADLPCFVVSHALLQSSCPHPTIAGATHCLGACLILMQKVQGWPVMQQQCGVCPLSLEVRCLSAKTTNSCMSTSRSIRAQKSFLTEYESLCLFKQLGEHCGQHVCKSLSESTVCLKRMVKHIEELVAQLMVDIPKNSLKY